MPSLRDQVRQRAKSRCEYCQLPQTCTVLPHEIDHILAQKHRDQTSLAYAEQRTIPAKRRGRWQLPAYKDARKECRLVSNHNDCVAVASD